MPKRRFEKLEYYNIVVVNHKEEKRKWGISSLNQRQFFFKDLQKKKLKVTQDSFLTQRVVTMKVYEIKLWNVCMTV